MSSQISTFLLPPQGGKYWQNARHKLVMIISYSHNDHHHLGKQKKTDFYQVLCLGSKCAGLDEIKKAYRSMALRYHPDVCPPWTKEESTRRFVELKEAYETLSDPVLRSVHDYELGLANSIDVRLEERRSCDRFPKAVWEKQLYDLRRRSRGRMERKSKKLM